jgi:hypothetical protein
MESTDLEERRHKIGGHKNFKYWKRKDIEDSIKELYVWYNWVDHIFMENVYW